MADRRHEWVPVAVWEVTRMIKRKDFIISTLLIPVLVVGSIVGVAWFKKRGESKVTKIAIARVDGSAATLPPLERFEWVSPAPGERSRARLVALVNAKEVEGALVLPASLAAAESVEAIVRWPAPGWKAKVRDHLLAQARIERAAALGLNEETLERLDAPVALKERLSQPAARVSRADRAVAMGIIVLQVMALFTAVAYMGIGISGEKQARVTEVVISAIPAQAWMDGKLVAFTVVGLLSGVVWAASLVVLAVPFAFAALLGAACWFMRLVAGRVFRLGMLMYGKDMTLPELIRWARVK